MRSDVALLRDWMKELPPRRREFGIRSALGLILIGLLLYFAIFTYLLPEMGYRLLALASGGIAVVLSGPVFTLPLYFASWFSSGLPLPGFPISLNQALAVAFLASWTVALMRRHFAVRNSVALWLLAGYTAYAVTISFLFRAEGAAISYQQLSYLAVCLATASYFRKRADFEKLIGAMLLVTVAIDSIATMELILGRDLFASLADWSPTKQYQMRINGMSKNAIQFANTAIYIMPWALLLHIEARRRWVRVAALGSIAYLSALCLMTYNRQSPVVIAAILVVGLALVRYRHKAILVGLMLLVAAAVAPLMVTKLVERFEGWGSADATRDISLEIRTDKYIMAWEAAKQNPWFGIGINNFKDRWVDYRQPGRMYIVHFDPTTQHYIDLGYLQLLAETGIVGVALFLALMTATFLLWRKYFHLASTWKHSSFHRNAFAAIAMGFAQLLLTMLLQDTFFVPQTYLLFGLFFALVTMTEKERARLETSEA